MNDLWQLGAQAITELVRGGTVSASEVVTIVLGRIREQDEAVHAYCTVAEESALEAAAELDARIARGLPVGPLAGVPVGVKDVLLTKGLRTTGACIPYAEFVPASDNIVVARLREADAVIIGKTMTYELAYGPGENSLFPQTRNPWDVTLSPGGSSSGSAAAVAVGMAPLAIGTDGGGSIRCPASLCGVFGFMPSLGRVPNDVDASLPGLSSWGTLGRTGSMTRTVRDAALTLAALSGPYPADRYCLPESSDDSWIASADCLRPIRILYSPDWGYATVDPHVRDIVDRAVRIFESDLGATVVQRDPGWGDPGQIMAPLIAADSDLAGMRRLFAGIEDKTSESIRTMLGIRWSAEDLTTALLARTEFCARMAHYMDGFDLLVTPAVASLPFPIADTGPRLNGSDVAEIVEWCPFTFPMNLSGQPAATVPAGWTSNGLPVGMQIAGRRFDDWKVLHAAAAFENASPWAHHWPDSRIHDQGALG